MPTSATAASVVGHAATTAAGRDLASEDLKKTMKKAFTALLIVAILQTIAGPILLMVEKSKMERENPGAVIEIQPWAYALVFGYAVLFWVLAIWARRNPLPAAITGLIAFVTLHLIDAIADPTAIARGIFLKIIVIAMLVSAIKAGIAYRKIQAEQRPALA